MNKPNTRSILRVAIAAFAIIDALHAGGARAAEETIAALANQTHFHGIAVDAADPSRIYLATHHGLFVTGPNGKTQPVSSTRDDFMGFTTHPSDPSILMASGHPAGGGNLGFILSKDGGRSWQKIASGVNGSVDFHQMDVSKADPNVVFGVFGDLQRSSDGGHTWARVAPAPAGIIALAASSQDVTVLYAATQTGLMRSSDGGRKWQPIYDAKGPATMAHVTRDGRLYAFVVGTGLIRTSEKNFSWQALGSGFGDDYVLHLAADPTNERKLYAVTFNSRTHAQRVIASGDGGTSWTTLGAE